MTNAQWLLLLDGLARISADPGETPRRRRRALWWLFVLMRPTPGLSQLEHMGNHRGGAAAVTGMIYDGYLD